MKQLIAANWKMNGMPDWVGKVSDLANQAAETQAELLICPPHPLIGALSEAAKGTGIAIGAQDCAEFQAGAHTGETDAALLASLGARYVIIGHSERRAAGETDAQVKAKAMRALSEGMRPIICVGESLTEREAGAEMDVVSRQLTASRPDSEDFDVAYEPIWAIGTGRTASVNDIRVMHAMLQDLVGDRQRILYGGSVKPANAAEILRTPNVGGALVGGASLEMDSFAAIAAAAI